MNTPRSRKRGWLLLLLAGVATVSPPPAAAQGILRDLYRAWNRGPLPEETTMNVPGKTVRIKVGEVETATWAGTPQWVVQGAIKFGPLRLANDQSGNAQWSVPDVHCLAVENLKKLQTDRSEYPEYDKKDGGEEFETLHSSIVLEFVLPSDQRLYGQTLTADLAMEVEYLGLQGSYGPPTLGLKRAAMKTPVSFNVASAEQAKRYSPVSDSSTVQNLKFYGTLLGCVAFLFVMGRIFFGGRR